MEQTERRQKQQRSMLKWGRMILCGLGIYICGRHIYNGLYRRYYKYPLGPYGLPFLGCIPYMKNEKSFYIYLTNTFGSMTMFYLGISKKIILINDSSLFCDLINNKYCLYRPTSNKTKTEPINIVISNGNEWSYRRKLMHKNFSIIINNSDFMQNEMTKTIKNTLISYIDNEIKMNQNKLFDLNEYIYYISFNIIFVCLFNHHLEYNSSEYQEFYAKSLIETNSGQSIPPIVSLFFGYNSKYLIKLFSDKMYKNLNLRKKIMNEYTFPKIIEWYQKYFNVKLNVNNNKIIINNLTEFNSFPDTTYGKLMIKEYMRNNKDLSTLLADTRVLFRAGIDGTAETVNYGIVLIAKKENIRFQQLIYNELNNEINKNNLNSFSIKIINNLHLFRSLIHEIMRIGSIARSGVPRTCTRDIKFKNYIIPKDSIIMPNMPYCHIYNKTIWGNNPKNINLNNWLNNNNKFKYNNNFIGFSYGKRDCPGKTFAIKSLYYIFGMLILRYIFKLNDQNKDIKIIQDYEKIRKIDPKIFVKIEKRAQ